MSNVRTSEFQRLFNQAMKSDFIQGAEQRAATVHIPVCSENLDAEAAIRILQNMPLRLPKKFRENDGRDR